MKTKASFILLVLSTMGVVSGEPLSSSWFTDFSGQYARVYPTTEAQTANAPVTSWDHPTGADQLTPTYAGVSEISQTATDVYIRTTGLGFHIMGPWYGGNGNLFPNYPSNVATVARFPRVPEVKAIPKTLTPGGPIGYFVDGIAMFDSRDAFSYINDSQSDAGPGTVPERGDGVWNRDAFVNESVTFDPANAHSAGIRLHYHANPPALRYLLGGSVSYDASANEYTEAPNGQHSPILAWTFDGYPVYGPYGYASPLDPGSGVRRMISGYQYRDGSNDSTDLSATGRTSLPEWITRNEATRNNPLNENQHGPDVDSVAGGEVFVLGHYLEDYAYKGDLGLTLGTDFDLNEYNVRWCATPDFPEGTWAYFTCIATDGTPVFPYNISRYYFGVVDGQNAAPVPEDREILFEGGPEANHGLEGLTVDEATGDVVLEWIGAEGGTYRIDRSGDLEAWKVHTDTATNDAGAFGSTKDSGRAEETDRHFYRSTLTTIAPFDDSGFDYTPPVAAAFNGGTNNVLLLIVDDWGIDSSPIDNSTALNPGTSFPAMPNLEALAARGLRFTNAYAQPLCSPTRATILTGRHAFRHGVGHPQGALLPSGELALPEIFTAQGSPYGLASYGKWHLGGGDDGPRELGGWTEFRGILGGGVTNYENWSKTENGVTTDNVTTYTTTDQVNEAIGFIDAQAEDPWFVWMGFNAPHTPFHNPPSSLHDYPSYATNADGEVTGADRRFAYEAALQALDTEIGRLLGSVDLETTNIILMGDNGTPGAVVQAPFGNGHAKGSLYEGGVHVPLVMAGPDVSFAGTSHKLVHCVDLFATILDLAGVDVAAATSAVDVIDSQSLVPVMQGADPASRCIVSESFGDDGDAQGRTIRLADHPDYKFIIFGDPTTPTDTSTYEMFQITNDPNEQTPLSLPPEADDAYSAAYEAFLAKDVVLGPNGTPEVLYLQLPNITGAAGVPGNMNLAPSGITIDGVAATYVARFDQTDTYDQFWVKVTLPNDSSPYTEAIVTFPDNPNTGDTREFTATQIVAP